jgi:hypothetical protein
MLRGGVLTFHLSFDSLLPALTAERKVIGVELQGHGHTADGDRPFSIRQCAEDVIALLDQLGIERADFFGYSLGGLVSTALPFWPRIGPAGSCWRPRISGRPDPGPITPRSPRWSWIRLGCRPRRTPRP